MMGAVVDLFRFQDRALFPAGFRHPAAGTVDINVMHTFPGAADD